MPANTLHLDRELPAPPSALQSTGDVKAMTFEPGPDLLPAIESATVEVPGSQEISVELRLLETGHQVVLTVDGQRWVETLTDVGTQDCYPPISQLRDDPVSGSLLYEARCTITEHSPRGLRRQRERALATCASASGSLVRAGEKAAGTSRARADDAGLCVFGNQEDEILWRSWRILPGANRLVQTSSTVWLAAFGSTLSRAS